MLYLIAVSRERQGIVATKFASIAVFGSRTVLREAFELIIAWHCGAPKTRSIEILPPFLLGSGAVFTHGSLEQLPLRIASLTPDTELPAAPLPPQSCPLRLA